MIVFLAETRRLRIVFAAPPCWKGEIQIGRFVFAWQSWRAMTWLYALRLRWHNWRWKRTLRKITAAYVRLGETSKIAAAAMERFKLKAGD